MYSKRFWDELYRTHINDVPWMSESHTRSHLIIMEKYLHSVQGKRLMDYGCGNGEMGYHFYEMGADVTLVDISDTLVGWLCDKYAASRMRILQAATPFDMLNEGFVFDIVIAGAVFHHIQPDLWKSFLVGFSELVVPGGLVVISGWDKSDVLFSVTNKAPYTHEPIWPINGLYDVIVNDGSFDIIEDVRYSYALPEFFHEDRIFRYYMLKKDY